jgi:hypothetical protein
MERKRLLRSEEAKAALMVQRAWALRKAKGEATLGVDFVGKKEGQGCYSHTLTTTTS